MKMSAREDFLIEEVAMHTPSLSELSALDNLGSFSAIVSPAMAF